MSTEELNIGLVGCGTISQYAHVPALKRTRRVRTIAVCDINSALVDRVATTLSVEQRYTDYDAFLNNSDLRAVVIAVPDSLHVPLALRALRAGKHVLVEKPMGISSEECQELVRVVSQTGLKLQVGQMKRHDPGMAYAHTFIREHVGAVFSVTGIYRDSLFRSAMQESCVDRLPVSPVAASPSGADMKANRERYNLWTQGVHLLDGIRFLAGDITAVNAQVVRQSGQSSWHGLLKFAAGGSGHFELTCKSCGDWWEQYTVYGETGSVDVRVSLPFYHRPAQVQAFDGQTRVWSHPLGEHSNAFANQLDAFAESVLHDKPTNPNVVDGLASVALLEATERALETGNWASVSLPDR